ncbi:MAG: tRNA (N6-threonylcarbamoyladenosine(37)-N6)-methyltransferase TrmO [Candidatus Thorarchaeota archaeon]|nr:tRNA (N6-threonylcarbamoyladenosine(37)-N6)-methyltransferase TrmO [Candidatus Thorarchaeota archaeon]
MSIEIRPIGEVAKEESRVCIWIYDSFWDATLNLDKFSHLIILWWISGRDNPESRQTLRVVPKGDEETVEESGVFACRSPARPNPIGHTVVALRDIDEAAKRLVIDQIDAFHGTPVLDIKPYMPTSDRVDGAEVPIWFRSLLPRYTNSY